jgi:hypothetical protein
MSTATAARLQPSAQPRSAPIREVHPRHVEIVATRAQRRARPKVLHALVVLGALFTIFIAQLLLSIAVSDGAYQIAGLQQSQKELSRTEDALAETLATLNSPQYLVANAAALGMVMATDAAYLRLTDGAVLAAPGQEIRQGCTTMCGLIGNELTEGLTVINPAATPENTIGQGAAKPGAASGSAGGVTSGGPSTEPLPAPVTR